MQRQYIAIDLNNAESKVMPILHLQDHPQTCVNLESGV